MKKRIVLLLFVLVLSGCKAATTDEAADANPPAGNVSEQAGETPAGAGADESAAKTAEDGPLDWESLLDFSSYNEMRVEYNQVMGGFTLDEDSDDMEPLETTFLSATIDIDKANQTAYCEMDSSMLAFFASGPYEGSALIMYAQTVDGSTTQYSSMFGEPWTYTVAAENPFDNLDAMGIRFVFDGFEVASRDGDRVTLKYEDTSGLLSGFGLPMYEGREGIIAEAVVTIKNGKVTEVETTVNIPDAAIEDAMYSGGVGYLYTYGSATVKIYDYLDGPVQIPEQIISEAVLQGE
jgi:hypothetical protein